MRLTFKNPCLRLRGNTTTVRSMNTTPKFLALIAFTVSATSPQMLAADVLSKYTLDLDGSGFGNLSILDSGFARGVMRYKGKTSSFSAEIIDGRFQIYSKQRGGMLDAQFQVNGSTLAVNATLAGEPISVGIRKFNGDKPAFLGKRVQASATIQNKSGNSEFGGRLTAEGEFYYGGRFTFLNGSFIAVGTVRKLLHLTYRKNTGLVTGRFRSSPFIGIVDGDTVSAICNNGTRVTIHARIPASGGSSSSSGTTLSSGSASSTGSLTVTGAAHTTIAGQLPIFRLPGTISVKSDSTLHLSPTANPPIFNITLNGTAKLVADSFANFTGTLTFAGDYVNTQNLGVRVDDAILPPTPGSSYPLNSIVILP